MKKNKRYIILIIILIIYFVALYFLIGKDYQEEKESTTKLIVGNHAIWELSDMNWYNIRKNSEIKELNWQEYQVYIDNKKLHRELEKQVNLIDKAEKFESEKQTILQEQSKLEQKYIKLEKNYNKQTQQLETDYNIKVKELEQDFNKKYDNLLKENIYLNKIINKFLETLEKFIHWICKKFAISEEDDLIRDFQKETNTFINPEEQIEYEENQEEIDI